MSDQPSERDQAINDLINQEIIADGRDALQAQDRASGGGGRGGSTNDLDNTP